MSTAADIAFDCPHCKGPLMAEAEHVGFACECPHCYAQLEVPDASTINKDRFVEPPGLRRILREVKDREWEVLRRKLRSARSRVSELEADLERSHAALAAEAAAPEPSTDKEKEVEQLRRQLAEVGDKFASANQAFMAGRKQQDTVIEHLRRELEAARGESQTLRKKNEELARNLQTLQQKLEVSRNESISSEDFNRLQGELDVARTQLTEARCQLDAEQAKVVLMEAAAIGVDESAEAKENAAMLEDLKLQVVAFRKDNASLRSARDKEHAEVVRLRQQLSESVHGDELETLFGQIQGSLNDAMEVIATKRGLSAAAETA